MNLSANFKLSELIKSETAIRMDIDNTPNQEQIESLRLLCENILQPVRDHFGKPVKISSGFRCSALNQAAGGSATSDHCKGQACDFEIDAAQNIDREAIRQQAALAQQQAAQFIEQQQQPPMPPMNPSTFNGMAQ